MAYACYGQNMCEWYRVHKNLPGSYHVALERLNSIGESAIENVQSTPLPHEQQPNCTNLDLKFVGLQC